MIKEELERFGIQMEDGLGLLIINFATYFPYSNQNSLLQEVSLSTQAQGCGDVFDLCKESVWNHRCPNEGYLCLTMKNGRKRSKIGCPIQMPYDEINRFHYLNIGYGFQGRGMARMSVSINPGVSAGTPCTALEVHLMLEDPNEPELNIKVYEKSNDIGWWGHKYSIKDTENHEDRFVLLTPSGTIEEVNESGWIVFNETITMFPSTLENILI